MIRSKCFSHNLHPWRWHTIGQPQLNHLAYESHCQQQHLQIYHYIAANNSVACWHRVPRNWSVQHPLESHAARLLQWNVDIKTNHVRECSLFMSGDGTGFEGGGNLFFFKRGGGRRGAQNVLHVSAGFPPNLETLKK